MKIFIIDDESFMRDMVSAFLKDKFPQDEGFTFENGESALKNIYQDPDVIILDFNLSKSATNAHNGVEVLKEIKKMRPQTPVIMLTGEDSPSVAIDAVKFGAYDYVVKNENAFHRLQLLLDNIHGYTRLNSQFGFQRMMNIVLGLLLAAIIVGILVTRFS